ncbi:hypothetical protein [Actinomadura sp. CNU-125]|uniref:hypothetical protein n=1 Tax=Actinomadura sp. CNU-125 TaxID=1904961 RepID=UPI00096ABB57|nr:hypothetical protein [Actinomadura sp. CNU-125]
MREDARDGPARPPPERGQPPLLGEFADLVVAVGVQQGAAGPDGAVRVAPAPMNRSAAPARSGSAA